MNSMYKKTFLGFALFVCFFIIIGCISEPTDETPLALVNGEPVTYGEFKRELEELHMKRNEKRGIGPIDIKGFLDKLIKKRLFIQEAIRTGLDNDKDVKLALDSELKRQAVLLLHKEEIDDKIVVSDDALWGEYCAEVKKRQDEVKRIKSGLSMDPNSRSMEVEGYITKFVPDKDSYEKAKNRLEKNLKKQERKKREDSYLKRLREKARISKETIDPNLLTGKVKDPNQPVAWINDEPVTLSDLRSGLKPEDLKDDASEDIKGKIDRRLQYIIDCRLIDQEALSKGYEKRPEVVKSIKAAEDEILYNRFFREILIPSIKIKDDEVETYYLDHKGLFGKPVYVKVEEIRLDTKEDVDKIRSELEAGADFTFLSRSSLPQRITGNHWLLLNRIPRAINEVIMQTEEGKWFGPVAWEKGYSIFLLKRRRGGEQIPFEAARNDVKERLWKERYNKAIKKWEDILMSSSDIVIYEDRIQKILSEVGYQGDHDIK